MSPAGWSIAADSPLLDHLDGRSRRARFTIVPDRPVDLPPEPRLLAGAATVDITPPPGMPKAGYSSNAHTGRAFRTRLRATITHLRSGTTSLALVQCDLLGGSSIVQHLVAKAVASTTDIPLSGIWIGATHTHAGPGQFLGTDFYNRFASNKSGFDPAFTQFLASRIAAGVQQAFDERRPARLAFGHAPVWGLTRNRSLDPYVKNRNVDDKRLDPQRKFVSVNPTLHLLRVDTVDDGGGTTPLSAAVTFAVHGTGVSQHTDEYHADVWAFLTDELGHRVRRATGTRPHVGAMEGTHADVAPALRPGQAGFLEAARIGRGIGAEAAELYARLADELRDDVELGGGLREIALDRSRTIDDVELPNRPAVGAALVAGATENLTPVINKIPPFAAGHPRKRPSGPQAEKHVIGSRHLQPLVLPLRSFPRVLSVQALRIGDAVLVGLPFELTTETGRRIESAVLDAARSDGIEHAVVSSVANEYSGYVATPEEYTRQYYEGGHTLYGPKSQPFLTAHAARLVGEVAKRGAVHDVSAERRYSLAVHRYLPDDVAQGVPRRHVGLATFHDPDATHDGYWEARWLDEAPGALDWHEPLVRVEAADGGGEWHDAVAHDRTVDDQWWALEVRHEGPGEGAAHRYVVRWWDPSFAAGRRHRFVLEANAGQPRLEGPPFD
jgi:neutral ceramidase